MNYALRAAGLDKQAMRGLEESASRALLCLCQGIQRRAKSSRPGEQRKGPVERPVVAVDVHLVEQQVIPNVALRGDSC